MRSRIASTPGTPANCSSLPAKSPLPPTGSRRRAGWNRRHREHSVMHARKKTTLIPFTLQDAPALIETVFPAQKVSFEAQRERKANLGQTLTGLGSYWKGRKPLILVRAIILGSLLPVTDDAEQDLELFEALMAFDIPGLGRRAVAQAALKPMQIAQIVPLANPWDYFSYSIAKGNVL